MGSEGREGGVGGGIYFDRIHRMVRMGWRGMKGLGDGAHFFDGLDFLFHGERTEMAQVEEFFALRIAFPVGSILVQLPVLIHGLPPIAPDAGCLRYPLGGPLRASFG